MSLVVYILGQLWKFNGQTLKSKDNAWLSEDEWNLQEADDKIYYINNLSKDKSLGTIDGHVEPQDLLPNNPKQMWKKEKADNEGYFILRNCFSQQVLTAGSGDNLEIKGISNVYYQDGGRLYSLRKLKAKISTIWMIHSLMTKPCKILKTRDCLKAYFCLEKLSNLPSVTYFMFPGSVKSRLVAQYQIFRRLAKGKFDAYVL